MGLYVVADSRNGRSVEHNAGLVEHNAGLVEHNVSLVEHNVSLVERDVSLVEHNVSLVERNASPVGHNAGLVGHNAGSVIHSGNLGKATQDRTKFFPFVRLSQLLGFTFSLIKSFINRHLLMLIFALSYIVKSIEHRTQTFRMLFEIINYKKSKKARKKGRIAIAHKPEY
jgi:hypothetical protein